MRDVYLKEAVRKCNFKHYTKSEDDSRLFPFGYDVVSLIWERLLKKAGFYERDPRTRRLTMRIHSLRKYFRSNMPTAGVPLDMVEALIGHEGYLTREYRAYTEEQLRDAYLKGVHAVTVFDNSNEPLRNQIDLLSEENIELKELIRLQEHRMNTMIEAREVELQQAKIEQENTTNYNKELKEKHPREFQEFIEAYHKVQSLGIV